jgi:hypothetical protein
MSPMAPDSAEKATKRPSGLISGDSGMSTARSSTRFSILPLTTLCSTSVLCFSVRAKYAIRFPSGDQDIHGTALLRKPPGVTMYS